LIHDLDEKMQNKKGNNQLVMSKIFKNALKRNQGIIRSVELFSIIILSKTDDAKHDFIHLKGLNYYSKHRNLKDYLSLFKSR
jgi:hypothetical protein